MKTFLEIENYINEIPKFAGKNSTEETRRILGCFPNIKSKIIHVAGTNGKGSVCAFLYNILQEAGYRCGFFTSPHLVNIRERIAVNNELISEEDFCNSFEAVGEAYKKVGACHPSYFEYLFLMGMHYFSKKNCDYIILETGLGGRLDATNSVEEKALTIITEIGKDHVQYLGSTFEEIAGEKAGIIRKGTPLVFFDKRQESTEVIRRKFEELNNKDSDCLSYMVSERCIENLAATDSGIQFSFLTSRMGGFLDDNNEFTCFDNVNISTNALYQCENAGIAIAGALALNDLKVTKQIILDGIKKTRWPGRMQKITDRIYVDGAHNPDGIDAMLCGTKMLKGEKWLLFAVVNDKDYFDMIDKIVVSETFSRVYLTLAGGSRATDENIISDVFKKTVKERNSSLDIIQESDNIYTAYDNCVEKLNAVNSLQKEVTLIVSGSLYLVGEILKHTKSI